MVAVEAHLEVSWQLLFVAEEIELIHHLVVSYQRGISRGLEARGGSENIGPHT